MDIAENDFGVFQGAEGAWFGVGHRGISQFFKVLRQTVMESTLICYICNQRPPTPRDRPTTGRGATTAMASAESTVG